MELHFKPTEEVVEKMRKHKEQLERAGSRSFAADPELTLSIYCMMSGEENQNVMRDLPTMTLNIHWQLSRIADEVEATVYGWALDRYDGRDDFGVVHEEDKGLIWFGGCGAVTREQLINSYIESLCIKKILVPTPAYFEDNIKFYEKFDDIKQVIAEFREEMYDTAWFQIRNELKDYEVNYEDDYEEKCKNEEPLMTTEECHEYMKKRLEEMK